MINTIFHNLLFNLLRIFGLYFLECMNYELLVDVNLRVPPNATFHQEIWP